ncbi:uncharacterized protein DFL_003729 [Arthrobotrys flagrans]|uniref:Uncharacterized protein n=1 Tax=Arthrobotrys flagrans TaxID=97331 RepID=A0A437A2N4_ARTFL|nr:hypothetical protein DFL_003729 [Arthrobotrys flagrans]
MQSDHKQESDSTSDQPTASWKKKLSADQHTPRHVYFKDASQFFAVDASGSTSGRIMKLQQEFTERMHSGHTDDQVVMWGSHCGNPIKDIPTVPWTECMGGTEPTTILQNKQALEAIGESDVWYLLTDGGISGVPRLTQLALDTSVVAIPTIFVITGYKGNAPSNLNISVGIAFYANASDVMILFKDVATGILHIIAGKGCFAPLVAGGSQATSPDLSSWDVVRALKDEAEFMRLCEEQGIRIPSADSRPKISSGVIRLGAIWEQANENMVREHNDLVNHALEQLVALSGSNFTAEILDRRSNRAKRAGTVAEVGEIPLTSLDLDGPTFRGECRCTLALNGESLFRENLKTVLPTLEFKGANRKYIESQLFVALTGGLRTGASGVSQLFMTILDQVLCEKE